MTAGTVDPRYHQYPQPFPLAEEATMPDGSVVRGGKARVWSLLEETARRRWQHPIGRQLGPAGAVPGFLLREPWAGGSAGDRRLRDLREHGVDYTHEAFVGADGETSTEVYRLVEARQDAPSPPPVRRAALPGERQRSAPLRFWTAVGSVSGIRGIGIQVGTGCGPSRRIVAEAVAGRLTPAAAHDAYLSELRAHYAQGRLDGLLEIDEELVLWVWPGLPIEVLAPLTHALTKLGATHLGTWQRPVKDVAA